MKRAGATILDQAASPYGLALFSYLVFVIAFLMPPAVYTGYMDEPDLLYLDFTTFWFFTLCVLAFVVGVWLVEIAIPLPKLTERKITRLRISPFAFLMAPLLAATALVMLSNYLLIKSNPFLLLVLAAQEGNSLKSTTGGISLDGTFPLACPILTGIVLWATWRIPQLNIVGWRKWILRLSVVLAILAVIMTALLTMNRNKLMLVSCGLAVIFLLHRVAREQMTPMFFLKALGGFICAVFGLFTLFSLVRAGAGWNDLIMNFLGYTVASYNRLSAVIHGTLHYPYGPSGVYLSSFLAFNTTLNHIFPFASMMHWPTLLDVWFSEFDAVTRSGLNQQLIWSGAFGYIFSCLGWWTPLFLLFYGVLYGTVWTWLKMDMVVGIVLYPCFAFCVFFWIGTNYLLDSELAVIFICALLLTIWERLLRLRNHPQHKEIGRVVSYF